ncbi:MAG: hypothetical protein ACXVZV_06680, partial [Terriglobales bacterium]
PLVRCSPHENYGVHYDPVFDTPEGVQDARRARTGLTALTCSAQLRSIVASLPGHISAQTGVDLKHAAAHA